MQQIRGSSNRILRDATACGVGLPTSPDPATADRQVSVFALYLSRIFMTRSKGCGDLRSAVAVGSGGVGRPAPNKKASLRISEFQLSLNDQFPL